MRIRHFNRRTDLEAVQRIWEETGWKNDQAEDFDLEAFIQGYTPLIAELENAVEGLGATTEAKMKYQDTILPMQAVAAVAVGRPARRAGLAKGLMEEIILSGAERGYAISALSMFEQGYYDKFGYGTGSYEHFFNFDPGKLKLSYEPRTPVRLNKTNWQAMHSNRLNQWLFHGNCILLSPEITKFKLFSDDHKAFGLGFIDNTKETLSHHMWVTPEDTSHGPYRIKWMAFQTGAQFLELMALIQQLGDQVHLFKMIEPAGVQLQDLLITPGKDQRVTANGKYQVSNCANAFWQARILNLEQCIHAVKCPFPGDLSFNLELFDPIDKYLDQYRKSRWKGLSGKYRINLGQNSSIRKGYNKDLPTLEATVNAFTRLWLGVKPASGLAITDNLHAPKSLLHELDTYWILPEPKIGWLF